MNKTLSITGNVEIESEILKLLDPIINFIWNVLSIWKATSYHRYIQSLSTITYQEAYNLYWLLYLFYKNGIWHHHGWPISNITIYNIRLTNYQSISRMINT